MVGAVVQVLVAEETSPSFLTHTLPRLRAGAVQTAGVAHTLAAGRALPPQTTLTLTRGLAVTVTIAAVRRADGCEGRGRGERLHTHTLWPRPAKLEQMNGSVKC